MSTLLAWFRAHPIDKYTVIPFQINLGIGEHLGIHVSSQWSKTFMEIVYIEPGSLAERIGLCIADRIFMVDFDDVWITNLDRHKLKKLLKVRKQFRLTVARKKMFAPSRQLLQQT